MPTASVHYDFGGYATRNNLKCADGRTIRRGAFSDNNGITVPLVWQHLHNSPENVLGHALLEERPDGMYCYGSFNNTPLAQQTKEQVMHGDITSLSIYANQLQQNGGDVMHGQIREVSLVLAGANPGAYIDSVIAHDGMSEDRDDEGIFYTDDSLYLAHEDDEDEDEELYDEEYVDEDDDEEYEEEDTEESGLDPDHYFVDDDGDVYEIPEIEDVPSFAHSAMGDRTVADVINSLSPEQKAVFYYIIDQVKKGGSGATDDDEDM